LKDDEVIRLALDYFLENLADAERVLNRQFHPEQIRKIKYRYEKGDKDERHKKKRND